MKTTEQIFDAIDRKAAAFMAQNDVDPLDRDAMLNIRTWAQSGRRHGVGCTMQWSLLEAIEDANEKVAEVDIESADRFDIRQELTDLGKRFR